MHPYDFSKEFFFPGQCCLKNRALSTQVNTTECNTLNNGVLKWCHMSNYIRFYREKSRCWKKKFVVVGFFFFIWFPRKKTISEQSSPLKFFIMYRTNYFTYRKKFVSKLFSSDQIFGLKCKSVFFVKGFIFHYKSFTPSRSLKWPMFNSIMNIAEHIS